MSRKTLLGDRLEGASALFLRWGGLMIERLDVNIGDLSYSLHWDLSDAHEYATLVSAYVVPHQVRPWGTDDTYLSTMLAVF